MLVCCAEASTSWSRTATSWIRRTRHRAGCGPPSALCQGLQGRAHERHPWKSGSPSTRSSEAKNPRRIARTGDRWRLLSECGGNIFFTSDRQVSAGRKGTSKRGRAGRQVSMCPYPGGTRGLGGRCPPLAAGSRYTFMTFTTFTLSGRKNSLNLLIAIALTVFGKVQEPPPLVQQTFTSLPNSRRVLAGVSVIVHNLHSSLFQLYLLFQPSRLRVSAQKLHSAHAGSEPGSMP